MKILDIKKSANIDAFKIKCDGFKAYIKFSLSEPHAFVDSSKTHQLSKDEAIELYEAATGKKAVAAYEKKPANNHSNYGYKIITGAK